MGKYIIKLKNGTTIHGDTEAEKLKGYSTKLLKIWD